MGAPALDRAVHDLHGPLTVIRGLCLGLDATTAAPSAAADRADRRRGAAPRARPRRARAPAAASAGRADLVALARAAAERFAAAAGSAA